MALPPAFQTSEEYFNEALDFFKKYQHLFNFHNIKVLSLQIFDKLDIRRLDCDGIFHEDFTLEQLKSIHGAIDEYLCDSDKFNVDFGEFEIDEELQDYDVPLSPKKKHEILYLEKEIRRVCHDTQCHTIVDFGSGLGYLDQLIFTRSDRKVLGIESNKQHYVAAKRRQAKYHPTSKDRVKYLNHTITEASEVTITDQIYAKFKDPGRICITGLHTCGELTVDALKLFLKVPHAKSLVLMSCCYHKMREVGGVFKNFPLSTKLSKISEQMGGREFLRVPFFRLAAQSTFAGQSLKNLVFNLLSRALIQIYADKYDYKLTRNKRKAVKTKSTSCNIDAYLQEAKVNFSLSCRDNQCLVPNSDKRSADKCKCNIEFNLDEVKQLWQDLCGEHVFYAAAIFVLLQRHLQPFAENLILYDRVEYLREMGASNCSVKKIFNEKISPRCMALMVT